MVVGVVDAAVVDSDEDVGSAAFPFGDFGRTYVVEFGVGLLVGVLENVRRVRP